MKASRIMLLTGALALTAAVVAPIGCGAFSPSVVQPAANLAVCVADEALKSKPVAQIAIDCSSDVLSVIAALLASENPQVRASGAYGEAHRAKVVLSAPSEDGGR